MNKINYVQNGISLLTYKTPKSFNFANLGLVTPSGKIIFSNEECALRYAKNSVVKALNGEKPFERGFVIQNSTVFAKSDGNASSVVIQRPSEGKYYTVHGHPDEYMEIEESTGNTLKDKIKKFLFYTTYKKEKNGIALPISIQDYRILMCHPNETKEIVYNSKGEYSILEKTQPNQCMNEYEFIANEFICDSNDHSHSVSAWTAIELFAQENLYSIMEYRVIETVVAVSDFFGIQCLYLVIRC